MNIIDEINATLSENEGINLAKKHLDKVAEANNDEFYYEFKHRYNTWCFEISESADNHCLTTGEGSTCLEAVLDALDPKRLESALDHWGYKNI
jgi:hypothetical protein